MGILDNTHLKFFTKSSFIDWIYQINNEYSNVNFNIEYLGSVIYDNSYLVEKILNNYYTKTEVDDCLQVLSQSIDSINACVITLSGQIESLQNNISKL